MTRKNLKRGGHSISAVFHLYSEDGMALVLTLLILVLITALVTEFSYAVFTTTSALYNWRDSQRLSFVAKSGTSLAVKTISDLKSRNLLPKFPGKMDIPVENILEGFEGSVLVIVEDEDGKFNLNSLGTDTKVGIDKAMPIFKNLLRNLGLNEDIADRVADWIDKDSDPRLRDSEDGAKNAFMDSTDELLLIKGIDRSTYERLLPYVTVYGPQSVVRININTASIPVIMSLDKNGITREIAEQIVHQRENEPFQTAIGLARAGVDPALATSLTGTLVFEPADFRITVVAEENKIKRVIESVVNGQQILYWKEM